MFRSRLPVISAVGHETDWTICDFVADLRAPTPSAAAEMVIASADELRGQVTALGYRLRLAMESRISGLESRVEALRRSLHDPTTMLGHLSQRVDDLAERLGLALDNNVTRRRERFDRLEAKLLHHTPVRQVDSMRQRLNLLSARTERLTMHRIQELRHAFVALASRLEVLSPLNTLSRGYAIAIRLADGKVVSDAAGLTEGERLRLSFRSGRATCRVEELEDRNA